MRLSIIRLIHSQKVFVYFALDALKYTYSHIRARALAPFTTGQYIYRNVALLPNNEIRFKWAKLHTVSKVGHNAYIHCVPSMINAGSFLTSKYVYLNKQIKNNHMVDHTILREAICVFLFLHATPTRALALICSMLLIYFVSLIPFQLVYLWTYLSYICNWLENIFEFNWNNCIHIAIMPKE